MCVVNLKIDIDIYKLPYVQRQLLALQNGILNVQLNATNATLYENPWGDKKNEER